MDRVQRDTRPPAASGAPYGLGDTHLRAHRVRVPASSAPPRVHQNGYCRLYKRLHRASFELPDSGTAERPLVAIDTRMLATICAASQSDLNDRFEVVEM
jgi:hypothetical protein